MLSVKLAPLIAAGAFAGIALAQQEAAVTTPQPTEPQSKPAWPTKYSGVSGKGGSAAAPVMLPEQPPRVVLPPAAPVQPAPPPQRQPLPILSR